MNPSEPTNYSDQASMLRILETQLQDIETETQNAIKKADVSSARKELNREIDRTIQALRQKSGESTGVSLPGSLSPEETIRQLKKLKVSRFKSKRNQFKLVTKNAKLVRNMIQAEPAESTDAPLKGRFTAVERLDAINERIEAHIEEVAKAFDPPKQDAHHPRVTHVAWKMAEAWSSTRLPVGFIRTESPRYASALDHLAGVTAATRGEAKFCERKAATREQIQKLKSELEAATDNLPSADPLTKVGQTLSSKIEGDLEAIASDTEEYLAPHNSAIELKRYDTQEKETIKALKKEINAYKAVAVTQRNRAKTAHSDLTKLTDDHLIQTTPFRLSKLETRLKKMEKTLLAYVNGVESLTGQEAAGEALTFLEAHIAHLARFAATDTGNGGRLGKEVVFAALRTLMRNRSVPPPRAPVHLEDSALTIVPSAAEAEVELRESEIGDYRLFRADDGKVAVMYRGVAANGARCGRVAPFVPRTAEELAFARHLVRTDGIMDRLIALQTMTALKKLDMTPSDLETPEQDDLWAIEIRRYQTTSFPAEESAFEEIEKQLRALEQRLFASE